MGLQGKQFRVKWLDTELTDIEDYVSYRNGTGTVQELDNDIDRDRDIDRDNDTGYRKFQTMRQELLRR